MNRIRIARRLVSLAREVMGFKNFIPTRELERLLKLQARREGLRLSRKGDRFLVLADEGGYGRFEVEEDHQGVAVRYLLVGPDGETERKGKVAVYHAGRLNRGWASAVESLVGQIARR